MTPIARPIPRGRFHPLGTTGGSGDLGKRTGIRADMSDGVQKAAENCPALAVPHTLSGIPSPLRNREGAIARPPPSPEGPEAHPGR